MRFLSALCLFLVCSVASATGIPRTAGVTCGGGGVTFAPSYGVQSFAASVYAPQVFAAPTCGVQSFAVQSYAPQVFAAPSYSYGVRSFAVPSYGFQQSFGINRGFAVQRGIRFNTGFNVNINRGLFGSNVNINRGFAAPVGIGAQQINIRSGLFGRQRVQVNSFGF